MFVINEDQSIYVTRGDIVAFSVVATEGEKNYVFKDGDVVRIKVFEKKGCDVVVLQKDFAVTQESERVNIFLTESDTRIGEVISKPTDYWYEVELNPNNNPQTILGYDEDGAKIFKLFPEGKDLEYTPSEEEIGTVDTELDITSERPVQNQAIARAVNELKQELGTVSLNTFKIQATIKNIVESEIEPMLDSAIDEIVATASEKVNAVTHINTVDSTILEASKVGGLRLNALRGDSDDTGRNTADCVGLMRGVFSATTGEYVADYNYVTTKIPIPCKSGDVIKVTHDTAIGFVIVYYNEDGWLSYTAKYNVTEKEFTVPDGATHFNMDFSFGETITLEDVGKVTLTVNDKYVMPITVRGKNMIPYPYVHTTRTYGGTTVTDNGDGTLTAEGTATATHYFQVQSAFTLPKGKYKLSGCPSGGGGVSYCVLLRKNGINTDKTAVDYGSGATFEVTDETTEYVIIICIYTSVTATNLEFKPMLCRCNENGAPFGEDVYEPYTAYTQFVYLDAPLTTTDCILESDGVWGVQSEVNAQTVSFGSLDTESQKALNSLKAFDGVTYVEFDVILKPSAFELKYGTSEVGGTTLENTSSIKRTELKRAEDVVSLGNDKVSYADIVNNLTSTDIDKPLSANMGRDVNSRIPSGGVRFEHLNPTAPSKYLTSLGITVDNTLTEIFAKLPVKSITYINVNAQNTTFAQCLPVQNGGVLTIKKGEDGRGQLQFDALDTGLSYSTYCKDFVVSLDWVSNDWEENSVASGWGSGFSTLASFWEYVERYMYKSASTSCMIKAKINSGCFSNGFTGWCRAWCSTQNAINSDYDVTGSIILVDGSDNVYYGRINGGKGDPSTLTDTWQQFITSLDVANNYTTTAAGYVADARTVKNLYDYTVAVDRHVTKRDWASTHTFTLKSGYFYLFVGLDCMYSAYVYSDGSVNVQQIYKASGSKVTYTTGNKTLTFKTSDGGTCAFMVITNAPA